MYLRPDSDDDSDGDYSPVKLPDGRMACYRHLRIVCHKCCVDFSFMEPHSESEADDSDSDHEPEDARQSAQPPLASPPPLITIPRGTGRVIPTKFTSVLHPHAEFTGRRHFGSFTRQTHRSDPAKVLLFTDGACLNNGQPNPRAGWAFIHGLRRGTGDVLFADGRLESKGPFGDAGAQTSNRAEMRAVIGALRFRYWPGEGYSSIVIATDSEYVVQGATGWVRAWVRNGWKTRTGAEVKNRDMWECLLGEFEKADTNGLKVEFWRIPREWNEVADAAAKRAAQNPEREAFMDIMGIAV